MPRGRWIGGTSVYFMSERGGHVDREKPCVTEIETTEDARSALFDGEDLPKLTMGRYDSGLSVILIPALRKAHETHAIGAASFPGLFEQDESGPEVRFPATELTAQRAQGDGTQELSCNCILNFLYGELKSKRTGSFTGPVTFGEIAYILLNQTMVRLQLHHLDQAAVA